MDTLKVDVAVIGAGTAGLNARREVEKRGGRPVMIESGPYGTTCARVGCMPSKLLVAAADAAHALDHAPLFGIHAGTDRRIEGPVVMQRVQRERDRFVGFVVGDTGKIPEEQRLHGHARFTGPTTLVVDGRVRVDARAVVVAAGSRPFVPPPFDGIRDRVLTSDDIFELPDLPESLAVIGTGIIALELGQSMHRLGVRVAFFNPFDELGPFTDPDVKRTARRDLSAELDLRLGIEMLAAKAETGGIRLRWREPGAPRAKKSSPDSSWRLVGGRISRASASRRRASRSTRKACPASILRRRNARTRRFFSPATRAVIFRFCMRRPTKEGSRGPTRCSGRASSGTSGACP